jgi:putative sigma-54 modulation protein
MKRGQRTVGEVNVQVKGKNMPVPEPLHDQIVRKMERLSKYLDRLDRVEVELSHEPTRAAAHQNHVEATCHSPGRIVRVQSEHERMIAAIDEVVDKLYRQLNRYKERMKTHQGTKLGEALPAPAQPADVPDEEDVEGEVPILVERLAMKPQFEDEAIEDMEASGRDFYVFLNARNEQVNVLYRRKDRGYGLIEPEVS